MVDQALTIPKHRATFVLGTLAIFNFLNGMGYVRLCIVLLVGLAVSIFVRIQQERTTGLSLLLLMAIASLIAFALQLFYERTTAHLLTNWIYPNIAVLLLATPLAVPIWKKTIPKAKWLFTVSLSGVAVFLLARIRLETSIRWLSSGYDNQQHLGAMVNALRKPDFHLPVVDPHPLAPMSIQSFWLRVARLPSQDVGFLAATELLTTISIPLVIVVAVVRVATIRIKSKVLSSSVSVLFVGVILFGYMSHLWSSGFLTSNFAVLVLVLLYAELVRDDQPIPPALLLSSGLLVSFSYPLLLPVWWAGVIHAFMKNRLTSSSPSRLNPVVLRILRVDRVLVVLCPIAFGIGVLLTDNNISRQLLLDGGIEPLPLIGIVALAIGLVIGAGAVADLDQSRSLITVTLVILYAGGLIYFSRHQLGQISYYPTKVAASCAVVLIPVAVSLVGQFEARSKFNEAAALRRFIAPALTVGLSYIPLSPIGWSSTTFKSSFMGSGASVLKDAIHHAAPLIDVRGVVAARSRAEQTGQPVLFLGVNEPTVLMTYWAQNLNGAMTLDVHGAHIRSDQAMRTSNFAEVQRQLEGLNFLIIALTPDTQKILIENGISGVCIWTGRALRCP